MKKLAFLLALNLLFLGLFGQISLEKTFNFSTNVTKINETTYKYFLMDVPNAQTRIYNLDFSVYKTINLPVPGGEWLYDVRFISENLFNDDAKLEILYTYYKWAVVGTSGYYVYHTKVINEDGVELLDAPGALYSYVKEVSENEYGLFLYAYDLSVDPFIIWTNIYSLPGKLFSIHQAKKSALSLNAYPNPASDFVNIDYTLPEGVSFANLHLIDALGREQGVYQLDGFTDHLRLQTSDFLAGTYLYYLESDGIKSETSMIIIQ